MMQGEHKVRLCDDCGGVVRTKGNRLCAKCAKSARAKISEIAMKVPLTRPHEQYDRHPLPMASPPHEDNYDEESSVELRKDRVHRDGDADK